MENENEQRKNLPRLDPSFYRGFAHIHWIFNIRDRKTGWFSEEFFLRFQLVATHTFLRYHIVAPCICLMPDHIHMLLIGYDAEQSDQRLAVSFLRKHLKRHIAPFEFQRPAYDHVLRESERTREAFQKTASYIRNNPTRAGLVDDGEQWSYECCIVPGYPDLHPSEPDFWDKFWRIYYKIQRDTP